MLIVEVRGLDRSYLKVCPYLWILGFGDSRFPAARADRNNSKAELWKY